MIDPGAKAFLTQAHFSACLILQDLEAFKDRLKTSDLDDDIAEAAHLANRLKKRIESIKGAING